jgi:electron transfer flavoprotein beta subunit
MTGVLVCVKRVPDSSSQVVLTEDAQAVDGRYAGFTMSPHEECAVELAVQVTAAGGGETTVLTLGDGGDAGRGRRVEVRPGGRGP